MIRIAVFGARHRSQLFPALRYARNRPLRLAEGHEFEDLFDAVLGAEVAERPRLSVGQSIILAHGAGEISFAMHEDKPFRVVGILGAPARRWIKRSM